MADSGQHPDQTQEEQQVQGQGQERRNEEGRDSAIVKIIGISGPSSSGKTTLSRALRDVFRSAGLGTVLVHEDDFYLDEDR